MSIKAYLDNLISTLRIYVLAVYVYKIWQVKYAVRPVKESRTSKKYAHGPCITANILLTAGFPRILQHHFTGTLMLQLSEFKWNNPERYG